MTDKIPDKISIGKGCYISFSSNAKLVRPDTNTHIALTRTEYRMLRYWVDNASKPVSLESMANLIWGSNYDANKRDPVNLKSHITHIRKKLIQLNPALTDSLVTNTGYGSYTFYKNEDTPSESHEEGRIPSDSTDSNASHKILLDEVMPLSEPAYMPVTKPTPEAAYQELSAPSLSCVFVRGRDDPNDVFVLPDHFIVPQAPLKYLLDTAFQDSNIHVISGQRGMGKSELARCFSRICCESTSCRDKLKYNAVVWTAYSEKGLEDTISKLSYSGKAVDNQLCSDKLRLLSEMKKPCLLVVDNYDNELSFSEELSSSSPVYKELLQCGCHILFTSKVNLSGCYAVRQTEIPPLPEDYLHSLFWELSSEEDTEDNRKKAAELIEKYLDRNTYLVILAAKLTETASLDDILHAFKNLSIAQMADPISAEKDGTKQLSASLFSQYKMMFNLSSVQDDLRKTRLLYNLALLPIDGMPYSDFFSSSFLPHEYYTLQLL